MKNAITMFLILISVFVAVLFANHSMSSVGEEVPLEASATDAWNYEHYYTEDDEDYNDKYEKGISTPEPAGESELVTTPEPTPTATPDVPLEVETDPANYRVLVNKEHALEEDYVPEQLVYPDIPFADYSFYEKRKMDVYAAVWLEKLFAAAREDGISLAGVSGYRSYATQTAVYQNKVSSNGQAYADMYSARPGNSEHQTGYAIDVSGASVGYALYTSFGESMEGKWLAEHAHKYGYIIRYQEDKTEITGYAYEPWHIRFVGKKLAKYLHRHNLTMEEYYDIVTKGDAPEMDMISEEEKARMEELLAGR